MECVICSSRSRYFFSKTYSGPYSRMMAAIGEVCYWKCENCGFVLSKTHSELDRSVWLELNDDFHRHLENTDNTKIINQPPYIEQATMLALLSTNGLVDVSNIIDYAGGYGTLSKILQKYFKISVPVYDPFIFADSTEIHLKSEALSRYNAVINSAMFEHILTRDDLESLNNLVKQDGALILHSVICENIPNDPNWFYLEPPVHTAFHTNNSMNILMEQWGYKTSIYCPQSKCWVLFKNKSIEDIQEKCDALNEELQTTWFYYKKGFFDYWKGF